MSHSSEPRPYPLEELLAHSGWLRGLAASLVADPGRADDLVQETWLAALRRPPRAGAPPRPWLARVFRNLARNAQRNAATRAGHEHDAAGEPRTAAPDAIAAEVETQRLLAECVGRLADPGRTIVVLRYFRGLDSAAIARELRLPPGTVRWRLKQALEQLRADLDRRCEGGRAAWSAWLAPLARSRAAEASLTQIGSGAPFAWLAVTLSVVLGSVLVARVWRGAQERPGIASTAGSVGFPGSSDEHPTPVGPPETSPPAVRVPVLVEPPPEAGRVASGAPEEGIELAGQVLVDGRVPEWPLELTLEPGLSTPSTASERALPAESGKARGPWKQLTLATEARGAFSFGRLPADWTGLLRVRDHDFEDGRASCRIERPASDLALRVRAGPALVGRLVDAHGAPVGDEWFCVETRASSDGQEVDQKNLGRFRTTADGRFRVALDVLEAPASGTLLLELDGRAYVRVELPPFDPANGLELGELVAEPVRALTFEVRNAEGAPIADAYAQVQGALGAWSGSDHARRSLPTGANGSGVLPWAPERAVAVRFFALGHAESVLTVEPGAAPLVALERLAVLEVRVTGPGADSARLVLTADEPAFVWPDMDAPETLAQVELGAAALVSTRQRGLQLGFGPAADGRFALVGLRPDVRLTLEVQDAADRPLASRSTVLNAGEWQQLELALD